jgi:outer membrane receptor protein involved in Fe transport
MVSFTKTLKNPAMPARARARAFAVLAALVFLPFLPVRAAAMGRVQGKVIATETGEAIGFADLLLIPADTTMKKVGMLSNADGTFLLVAPAGHYTLQIRALSYATKRIDGVAIEEGQLLPLNVTLTSEAIQQKEVVVEATAKQNTDASMMAQRRKAATVGDAVSAEQMRRAPDKNASDVLKRVTGLSVSDNKYVYVRGMGERYNSTEVDGVRVVSPEANKRVVPMDLFPAALLDNIVVQKAWSADRSGEFSGGDVQVHLKDFPGKRAWSLSLAQGSTSGTTFGNMLTYTSSSADVWGFGASSRGIPSIVNQIAGNKPLTLGQPPNGFPASTLQQVEKDFANVWTPHGAHAAPNGNYALTYGDEWKPFGRPVGMIGSWTFNRSLEQHDEVQRFTDNGVVAKSQYDMTRSNESVQMGANASLSFRPSPSHRLSVRGLYTNKADDEVVQYEGLDPNAGEFFRRATKLTYVQRDIRYATVEGTDDVAKLFHSTFDWQFTRSLAHRQQPDKREATYIRVPLDESNPGFWGLATGRREYGDIHEDGWSTVLKLATPYKLGGWGSGRWVVGYDRQSRARVNGYRRFDFIPGQPGQDAPPESVYDAVNEATIAQDNYHASQLVEAYFVSTDVPLGKRVRGNVGLRREQGDQQVASHDLFNPGIVTSSGSFRSTDWLAGGNLTWAATDHMNVRAAASRTLNRPDMDDLSTLQALDFAGDRIRIGNPHLVRALIANYDLRVEAFPGLGDVLAAGVFYKNLQHPIEPALFGTNGQLGVRPENSEGGHNIGGEFEVRSGLGKLWSRLDRLSFNSNLSFISSKIRTAQTTNRGNTEHPLVGQAPYLFNVGLTYTSKGGHGELSVLTSMVGRRLKELNITQVNASGDGIPNLFTQGSTTLDATASFAPMRGSRLRIGAGNLLNTPYREAVGDIEMRRYTTGRTYSVAFSLGS